jgi:hypothetical protein
VHNAACNGTAPKRTDGNGGTPGGIQIKRKMGASVVLLLSFLLSFLLSLAKQIHYNFELDAPPLSRSRPSQAVDGGPWARHACMVPLGATPRKRKSLLEHRHAALSLVPTFTASKVIWLCYDVVDG